MRGAALALLAALAGCAPAPRATGPESFRDLTAQLASKADFDPARFAGTWHEVARFPGTRGCPGGRLRFDPAGPATLAQTTTCPDGSVEAERLDVAPFGRLTLAGAAGPAPLWVLWTDASYRTAVVVAPDGTGGRILDRAPASAPDRLRAAREVLDFNGFDADRLRTP